MSSPVRLTAHPPRHASGLGIDLAAHHLDVRRVTLRKYGRAARRAGIDPDDLVQEVCLRIHRHNSGASAYDPSRAAMTTYIRMQARSALLNLLEKRESRIEEQLGFRDRDGVERDVALADHEAPDPVDVDRWIREHARTAEEARALRMMAEGATDFEVIARCGSSLLVLRTLAAREAEE